MINLTINKVPVQVNDGETVLDAAHKLGIDIPTLCHFRSYGPCAVESKTGSCRVCVVEIDGRPNLAPSCCTPATEGMKVVTSSMRVINARRTMLDLLLSDHPKDCLTCEKSGDCQLQDLASKMGLHRIKYKGEMSKHEIDVSSEAIVRDPNKCIMCRRCEVACNEIQTVGVLSGIGRGFSAVVGPADMRPLSDTKCTFCGRCVAACPTGALTEVDHTYKTWNAINSGKTVVVQTAPAVRVALGEAFGMAPGAITTGKMVTALRMMGFAKVFDTDFSADLTIMEETTEFIARLKEGKNLPILTSCCPGWVKFFEHQFKDLMHIPSTCKSPQQMFGAIAKTYYANKIGVKAEDMIVVSVMPCLAKKYEAAREEFNASGARDVDIVISTRELAAMIKEAGIAFDHLEESKFDNPLGESTGAAVIFGATGGVLEAALRTAADWITGQDLQNIDFTAVRGLEGIKEATVKVGEIEVHAAIASGLGNARKLLEKIRKGQANYHIIEIMACPGGCLNGGGQPFTKGDFTILDKRMQAIYADDKNSKIRKSHQNPSIIQLYKEFLGKPGSEESHKLLHTHYHGRKDI